jgi:hypothetical protein
MKRDMDKPDDDDATDPVEAWFDWDADWEAAFVALHRSKDTRPLAARLRRVRSRWAIVLSHLLEPDTLVGYRLVVKRNPKGVKKRNRLARELEIYELIEAELRDRGKLESAVEAVSKQVGLKRAKSMKIWQIDARFRNLEEEESTVLSQKP